MRRAEPGELDPVRRRRAAQVRDERLRLGEGVGEEDAPVGGARAQPAHALQDPRLGPLAEPLHAAHPPVEAGALELGEVADPERRLERRGLLRPEVRDLDELERSRRVPRAEPLEQLGRAGPVQVRDLPRERLADPLHLGSRSAATSAPRSSASPSTARAPFS